MISLFTILVLASTAAAHFHLYYPYWRGDSLGLSNDSNGISQWNYPCAGIDQQNSSKNRTAWPLDGGSIHFAGSHPWAFTYVNLGLGEKVVSFNISLVEGFNQTGNGSFCFSKAAFNTALSKAEPVKDGDKASIQVIQISHSGSSLYNCADIVFRSNATLLANDQCYNATGVGGIKLQNAAATAVTANGSAATNGTSTGAAIAKSMTTGTVVGALAIAFAALL